MIIDHYDVIGGIHGHARALRRLLREMDYRDDDGIFRQRDRRVSSTFGSGTTFGNTQG
jgi:hypothetical protein